MARTKHRLTAKGVENLKAPGLHADGGNLHLRISVAGSKSWIFRFTRNGRARDAGLGSYPEVRLADARIEAEKFRQAIAGGIDPIEARNASQAAAKAEAARAVNFRDCANAYIASHEVGWKNDKHKAQWHSTLKSYVFPIIGAIAVKDVSTGHILQILEPIWQSKPETASRVRGRLEVILSWAKVRGYRDGENPAQWRGHLDQLLPAKGKVRRVVHHAALPYREVPCFMKRLAAQSAISARALEFLILTTTRTGEALGATWTEINWNDRVWIIAGERMKASRQHRVPLSARAMEILREMYDMRSGDLVFAGMKPGRPLSQMSLLMLLRRMGFAHVTVHGFRSTFRDWAAECHSVPFEVAEMALAHAVANSVEAAYRRGDMLQKRRKLMDDWGSYCEDTALCFSISKMINV